MKKIISLLTIILIVTLQSCRQDDEHDLPKFEERSLGKSSETNRNNNQSASKDSANKAGEKEEDPPVKNGTHWRIKN